MSACEKADCACRNPVRHPLCAGDLPIGMPLCDVSVQMMSANGAPGVMKFRMSLLERADRLPVLHGQGVFILRYVPMRMAVILRPMCTGGTMMIMQIGDLPRAVQRHVSPPSAFFNKATLTREFAAFLRNKRTVNRRSPFTTAERAIVRCFVLCMHRHASASDVALPALPSELVLMILGMLTLGDLAPPAPALALD